MNRWHTLRTMTAASLVAILLAFCIPLEAKRSRYNNRKKKPTKTTIIKAVASTNTQSFAYYQQKTYEFLRHLNARNIDTVSVEIMPQHDPQHGSAAGYANGSVIRLNMESFRLQSHAQNLFTCAHEAAHYACGHTYIHPHTPRRSSFVVEQEADEAAARMLCTHGYAWVVEECVKQLHLHIQYGSDAHTSDGVHPTYAQQHTYLKIIVAKHVHNRLYPQAQQPIMPEPETPRAEMQGSKKSRFSTQEFYIYTALCASVLVMYLKNKWYSNAVLFRI